MTLRELLEDVCTDDEHFEEILRGLGKERMAYRKIEKDSSEVDRGLPIFREYFERLLEQFGYDESQRYKFSFSFNEAFSNAVIHGNRGGPLQFRIDKELEIPVDLVENQKKAVIIEAIICSKFYIFRIIDQGNGFDTTKPIEAGADGELTSPNGRGRYYIDSLSSNHYYKIKDKTFSITIITYAEKPVLIT